MHWSDIPQSVFERFRQADSSQTRQHGGLGLGLAICRYVTEAHGGGVIAASEGEGKGSTFTVQLPLLNSAPAEESASETTSVTPTLNGHGVAQLAEETAVV